MFSLSLIITVTVGIQLVFFIFRKIDPIQGPVPANFNLAELKKKYRWWDRAQVLGLFVLAPILAVLAYLVLKETAVLVHSLQAKAEIKYTMMDIYWWLPAMFLGMMLSLPVLNAIPKRFMRKPYDLLEYEMYQARWAGFKTGRMTKIVFTGTSFLCAGAIVLGLTASVALQGDEFIVHPFFSLGETRHSLNDIKEIRTSAFFTAPNGDKVARREYLVVFKPTGSWTTNNLVADLTEEQKAAFIKILSERSGKPIVEVPIFSKSDFD